MKDETMSFIERLFDSDTRKRFIQYLYETSEKFEDIAASGPNPTLCDPSDFDSFELLALCEVVKNDPSNGFNYLHLAQKLRDLGMDDAALKVYESLNKLNISFLGYYDDPLFNVGILQIEKGVFDEAIIALEKCCLRYPEDKFIIAYFIGYAYHKKGNYKDALNHYRKSISFLRGSEARANSLNVDLIEKSIEQAKKSQALTIGLAAKWHW